MTGNPDPSGCPAMTVDEYLAALPAGTREELQRIRAGIRAAAPEAEELIGHRIPTFRSHGSLVNFAAFPDHPASSS